MAEQIQYLRLELQGRDYLLPAVSGYSIEQRDVLSPHRVPGSHVVAWKAGRTGRWGAYALNAELQPARHNDWQRAVFLEAAPKAVGLACEEVQLLPRTQTQVAPFVPPGTSTLHSGHLFQGAWLQGTKVILVLNPRALAAYLQGLGE